MKELYSPLVWGLKLETVPLEGCAVLRYGKHPVGWLLLVLVSILALGGCGGGSDKQAALAPWEGTWKSLSVYLDDPALTPSCEAVAAHNAAYTPQGVLGFLKKMYRCDFAGMVVKGDSVTFRKVDGSVLGTVSYRSAGTAPIPGNDKPWHLFEAVGDPGEAYRYLALVEVHSDGPDAMKHWHLRYGNTSLEALVGSEADATWWPTMAAEDTTAAAVAADLGSEAEAFAQFLGNPWTPWLGTWVSVSSYLDDPAMEAAYAAVVAEATKLGKSYDTASVKAFFKGMLHTPFASVRISADATVFLTADGTELGRGGYVYQGVVPMPGFEGSLWDHWTATGSSPAGYGRILTTAVHSDGPEAMKHWHMRFGDASLQDLVNPSNPMWFPTCVKPETTAAVFAEDVKGEAAAYAAFLP